MDRTEKVDLSVKDVSEKVEKPVLAKPVKPKFDLTDKVEVDRLCLFNLRSYYRHMAENCESKDNFLYETDGKFLHFLHHKKSITLPIFTIFEYGAGFSKDDPIPKETSKERKKRVEKVLKKLKNPTTWLVPKKRSLVDPCDFGFTKMPESVDLLPTVVDLSTPEAKKKTLEHLKKNKDTIFALPKGFSFFEFTDSNSERYKKVMGDSFDINYKDFLLLLPKEARAEVVKFHKIPLGNPNIRSVGIIHEESKEVVSISLLFRDSQNSGSMNSIHTLPKWRRKKLCTNILAHTARILIEEMKVDRIVGLASLEGNKVYSKFLNMGVINGNYFSVYLKMNIGEFWRNYFWHYAVKFFVWTGLMK